LFFEIHYFISKNNLQSIEPGKGRDISYI
jgi:hypothetical protein